MPMAGILKKEMADRLKPEQMANVRRKKFFMTCPSYKLTVL